MTGPVEMADCNDASPADLVTYRTKARTWLADNAPGFSGEARRCLSPQQDLALGRAWQALKAANGYAAITLSPRHGGGGGDELAKIVFTEEELHYDLPTDYFLIGLNNALPIFLRYAPEDYRDRLAPPAIRGEQVWCQLFSEPAAGSDLAALRLKAVRDGDGWRLSGQKSWTSWAHVADWGVIVTRTDPTLAKHAGLTYFFVDMHAPGIEVRQIRRLVGESEVCEVFFDDVFVPDSQRLGKIGDGFRVAIETLMIERYGGVIDETVGGPPLEDFIALVGRSALNGRPAIQDGQIRAAIADALVERRGLRSIYRRALAAVSAGKEPGPEGAIRKLLAGRTRQQLGKLAIDLLGAEGVRLDPEGSCKLDFASSWLDPVARIAGGTDEILLNTLAEKMLGLPQDHRPDKGVPFNQIE